MNANKAEHDEKGRPEQPVIRPPSEWRSVLVRLTRGCRWNRCRFCGIYPQMGEPGFSVRGVEDIQADIERLRARRSRPETAFFGDSDPLEIGVEPFVEVARHLRRVFPEVKRLTCYARASTLWKIGRAGIRRLADGGLNRAHIGLESGDDATLRYHRKGQTRRVIVETGRWLKEAGIEVSHYVLLGLGGRDGWERHMDGTVEAIHAVNPEFVRMRRLWIYGLESEGGGPESPLCAEIRAGRFAPQTAEGTVLELKRLLERLEGVTSRVVCDHENNYVRVEGQWPQDRAAMLGVVNDFLALPEAAREAHYRRVGSTI